MKNNREGNLYLIRLGSLLGNSHIYIKL